MLRALIVGLGSPQGDDQVGWKVLEKLANLPAGVQAMVLREPTALWDHLVGCKRLIVIDACQGGAPAGEVHRLTWPVNCYPGQPRTAHGFDLVSLLRLAESLRKLPAEVVILAVETKPCQQGNDLSPPVVRALPGLVEEVLQEANK